MPTNNYNLPTISGEEVIDIVGDMNALANATDAALQKVEQGGLDPYVLPTASRTVKGGVIVGDGLSITSGGVLSTVSQGGGGGTATLPVATSVTLGGVKIGSGITVTTDGTISVPASSSIEDGAVTSSKISNGAVTADKIANGSVTSGKLSTDLNNDIQKAKSDAENANSAAEQANNSLSSAAQTVGTSTASSGTVEVYGWNKVVIVQLGGVKVNTTTKVKVGQVNAGWRPVTTVTTAIASSTGSGIQPGFLQVDTAGGIYINPGSVPTGNDWTGMLTYLLA